MSDQAWSHFWRWLNRVTVMIFLHFTLKLNASNYDWTEKKVELIIFGLIVGGGFGSDALKKRVRDWLNDGERNHYAGDD